LKTCLRYPWLWLTPSRLFTSTARPSSPACVINHAEVSQKSELYAALAEVLCHQVWQAAPTHMPPSKKIWWQREEKYFQLKFFTSRWRRSDHSSMSKLHVDLLDLNAGDDFLRCSDICLLSRFGSESSIY